MWHVFSPRQRNPCRLPDAAGRRRHRRAGGGRPARWETVRPLFRTRSGAEAPADPAPGRFLPGRLGGEVADEVILAIRRMGPSQRLELHCHGGRAAVRFLLDLLAGAAPASATGESSSV